MMVTLIMEAQFIPDGTTVRKITGQMDYTLRKELNIYGEGQQKIATENVVFLIGDTIKGYPHTTKFAIDLTKDEAREFLNDLTSSM